MNKRIEGLGMAVFDDKRHELDTPELVAVDYEIVGLGSRFAALMIDNIIVALITMVVVFGIMLLTAIAAAALFSGMKGFFSGDFSGPGALVAGFIVAGAILFYSSFYWGYHVFFETTRQGRTPGKRLAGIQVVKVDGTPLAFRDSAVRNLLRIVDTLPVSYLVGAVVCLTGERGQRVGDISAGTIVVRTRGESYFDSAPRVVERRPPARPGSSPATNWADNYKAYHEGTPPRPAAQSASYAAAVASARLTPQEYDLLVNFFNRSGSLQENRQREIANALAARLAGKYSIPLEQGIKSEKVLRDLLNYRRQD